MKLYCLQQSTVSILVVLDVVLEVETGYTETRSTRVSILVVLDVVLEDNFFVLQRTYHFLKYGGEYLNFEENERETISGIFNMLKEIRENQESVK